MTIKEAVKLTNNLELDGIQSMWERELREQDFDDIDAENNAWNNAEAVLDAIATLRILLQR